jgi:hypothetical protein
MQGWPYRAIASFYHRRCIYMSTHKDDKSQSESGGQQHQGGQKSPGQQNQGGQRGQPAQQDQGGQRGQPGQQNQGQRDSGGGQQGGGSNRDKTADMNRKEGSNK